MFKLIGSAMVIISSIFLFTSKVFENFFTCKFIEKVTDIIQKMQYETASNQPYDKIFEKIRFSPDGFIKKAYSNGYIDKQEIKNTQEFFNGLGSRDSISEQQYIVYSLDTFKRKHKHYYDRYNADKKVYTLCGISAGFFIIIFFI